MCADWLISVCHSNLCNMFIVYSPVGNSRLQFFMIPLGRNDESLWRRIDLAQKTVKARTVGKLVRLGTTHLRLARADVSFCWVLWIGFCRLLGLVGSALGSGSFFA